MMNTLATETRSSSQLTPAELATAENLLNSSRERLMATISGLSDAQWHFKPSDNGWSIADNLEHLVLIEERVHGVLGRLPDAPPAETDRVNAQVEQIILSQVPSRSSRVQAPPPVSPAQRWPPAQMIEIFPELRARTLKLLFEAPSLRGSVLPHPFFGNWDGYQWILAAAAHSARHTNQMLEVKSCPGFPEH